MSKDTILSALLDYYSDKASAEASAVVATTFGLFVVLTASGHRPWAALIYWLLWFAGLYFLLGFGYWAAHATCTKHFLVGRKQLKLDEKTDHQIENIVRNSWKKTLLRNVYCLLKLRIKLSISEWFRGRETKEIAPLLRLSDLLHTLFFLFGASLSSIFFPKETWSFCGFVSLLGLSILFYFDAISVLLHRRVLRSE